VEAEAEGEAEEGHLTLAACIAKELFAFFLPSSHPIHHSSTVAAIYLQAQSLA
jgi:hypothetical protein